MTGIENEHLGLLGRERGTILEGASIHVVVPFPQYPGKHLERPLFTPEDFHRYLRELRGSTPRSPPRNLIVVFGRRWRRYLSRRHPGTLEHESDVYRLRPDVGVAVLDGTGAPFAGMAVEEYFALGVQRIVIVGAAGSLQPELRMGRLVLCTRALRDEGVSHHYSAPGRFVRPAAELMKTLRSRLETAGTPFVAGATWTIDAPYRETVAEIRRYRGIGILTVEMEAAAVFAIARRRKRQAAALFVISDNLDEREWEPRFHDSRAALRTALTFAVGALAT